MQSSFGCVAVSSCCNAKGHSPFFIFAGVGAGLFDTGEKGGERMAEQKPANRKRTGNKTSFKPGQSGNPNGRPKMTEQQRDALQAIRELTNKAADVLEKMLTDESTPPAQRLKAAEMILDRTYGKAEAKVNMDAKVVSGDFVLRIGAEDDAADS